MTVTERRLQAEWDLLEELARLNPGRIDALVAEDRVFRFTLHRTPVPLADPPHAVVASHAMRIFYPGYFPAAPLEVYTDNAFLHPNVHPVTGFVCVWNRHRVSNTVEHAVHKLVAMMSGRLSNAEALHRMQTHAWKTRPPADLGIQPLRGITHQIAEEVPETKRRIRLS